MDYQLERWINAGAGQSPLPDAIMRGLAAGAEVAFIALVASWLVVGIARRRPAEAVGAITALFAAGVALLANLVISHFWYRPRPFVDHGTTVHLLLGHSRDASFPSDHAAAAVAIGVVLVALHRRVGIATLLVAMLVGYARVYVGDHYPSDVLGGALVGLLSAILVSVVVRRLLLSRLSAAWLSSRERQSGWLPTTQRQGRGGRSAVPPESPR